MAPTSNGKVHYKPVEKLEVGDMAARIAAGRLREAWFKERRDQLLGFGAAFTFMGLAVLSVIALTSGILGDRLRGSPSLAIILRWLKDRVLVALGLRLALPERR